MWPSTVKGTIAMLFSSFLPMKAILRVRVTYITSGTLHHSLLSNHGLSVIGFVCYCCLMGLGTFSLLALWHGLAPQGLCDRFKLGECTLSSSSFHRSILPDARYG